MKSFGSKIIYFPVLLFSALIIAAVCFALPAQAALSGQDRITYLIQNEGYMYRNPMSNQPADKSFTVKFSQNIDTNTAYSGVEIIESQTGDQVPISLSFPGSQELKITPQQSLITGKSYYLILHNTIKNDSAELTLKNGIIQEFSVGNLYSPFAVSSANITGVNQLEIRFNEVLDRQSALDKNNYQFIDGLNNAAITKSIAPASVVINPDGRGVKIALTNDINPRSERDHIVVSANIKNIYGITLGQNYQQDLYLVNRSGGDWSSDNLFNSTKISGNVDILAAGRSLKKAEVDGDVYVAGDNTTLEDLTVKGTLFLDPGVTGTAVLNKVTADSIELLSGQETLTAGAAISLNNVDTDELFINSRSETKVEIKGQTDIYKTVIQFLDKDIHLVTDASGDASFGRVEISQDSSPGRTLKLEGIFDKSINVYKPVTISNIAGFINKVEVAQLQGNTATVVLESIYNNGYSGYFKEVAISKPVNLLIKKAQIGYLKVQTIGVDLLADSLAYVRSLETSGKDSRITLEEGAQVAAPTIASILIKPGAVSGTTKVSAVSHPEAQSFMYKVQSCAFAQTFTYVTTPQEVLLSTVFTPYMHIIQYEEFVQPFVFVYTPESDLFKQELSPYTAGEDISVLIGQDLGIAALDYNNRVVAFLDYSLEADEVNGGESIAPALDAVALPGSANKTTRVIAEVAVVDKLAVQISKTMVAAPKEGDVVPSGVGITIINPYTCGADISGVNATTNKYLGVYELNADNQVVKFKAITLTPRNIKGSTSTAGIATVELYGSLTPGKQTVIITLTADDPANYRVVIDGCELTYDAQNQEFYGDIDANLTEADVRASAEVLEGIQIKTIEFYSSMTPGKKMVAITIDVDDPENYKVTVDGVELTYDSQYKEFTGDVDESQANEEAIKAVTQITKK